MSVILSSTSKNAPLLIYNGLSYIVDRRSDKKILWKCEHARKFKCRARLQTDLNNVFIQTVGDHENHTGDPRSGPIRQYYDRLRRESQQNQAIPHNILTQTNIGVQDEVRVQLTSNHHLKRNIRRWRQETNAAPTPFNINFPVVPDNYHQTTRDTIFLRKDTGPASDRILIFFTDEQRNIMENATDFFIDGTFKVVPEFFFQLFVIHANYRDHIFPVLFVLLTGKSGQIYQKMMNEIMALVPGWSPRRVMMDFEKAAMNMVTSTFPTVELSGCFFHLSQSVQRFLQTHGFKQNYETDIIFADNIHKILALAFLEPNQVISGFESLCSNLGDEYQSILDYMEDNYIGRLRGRSRRAATFPIIFWNMAARVKNNMYRTNNNIEAWHRKLNCAFQCTHPTLWTFINKLIKEENNIHSDVINAMSGRLPPKQRNESLNQRLQQFGSKPTHRHPGSVEIRRTFVIDFLNTILLAELCLND
ncbi:unnamed protein product [Rotaria socialis]|uniref:MULE transposase domain-containing protein n=1 Tax=Rotaria socialis TaxID=392032 RepID=A0A818FAH7_9BILA|nr:unnamed protein product [Rotaria socialis]CAF3608531.1 unnamed protein product [Rotaria socialis]